MTEQAPKRPGLMERLAQMIGLKPAQAGMIKLIAVALALGILFLNAGELFGVVEPDRRPASATEVITPIPDSHDELIRLERTIAANLEEKLSLIQGAGRVHVSVTLEATPTTVAVADTKQQQTAQNEKATDGSTRHTETTQLDRSYVITRDGNRDILAVQKKDRAPIAGVLIVAEGAADARVRAALHAAAVTALGAPAHRVSVVASQRR